MGFRNKEIDEIIEDLQVTFDQDKRIELYHKFHKIIYEEQPYTFFKTSIAVYAWQDYIKNVTFKKFRPHPDSMLWYVDKPAD